MAARLPGPVETLKWIDQLIAWQVDRVPGLVERAAKPAAVAVVDGHYPVEELDAVLRATENAIALRAEQDRTGRYDKRALRGTAWGYYSGAVKRSMAKHDERNR